MKKSELKKLIKEVIQEAAGDGQEMKILNKQLKALGFKPTKQDIYKPRGVSIEKGTIPLKSLGKFSSAFEEIMYEVAVQADDRAVGIVISYTWKHPNGGSNGYEVRHIYRFYGTGKWEIN